MSYNFFICIDTLLMKFFLLAIERITKVFCLLLWLNYLEEGNLSVFCHLFRFAFFFSLFFSSIDSLAIIKYHTILSSCIWLLFLGKYLSISIKISSASISLLFFLLLNAKRSIWMIMTCTLLWLSDIVFIKTRSWMYNCSIGRNDLHYV